MKNVKKMEFSKSLSLVNSVNKILVGQKKNSRRVGNIINLNQKNAYLIIGDIHGDFLGLRKLFSKINISKHLEDKSNKTIFLGDYIDRGPQQLEALEYVLNLFQNNPTQIILIRGNHEGPSDLPYFPNDFKRLIRMRFNEAASTYLDKLQILFDNLLTGVLIEEKALLVHGGIPTHGKGIGDIAYAHKLHPIRPHLEEILWNDPMAEKGVKKSPRGAGYMFGPDITDDFLRTIKVKTMIRGHEAAPEGYKVDHGQILTIFSSTNRKYRNTQRTALYIEKNHSFNVKDLVEDLVFF